MQGPFHNKSGVIVNWENVWMNNYVKCTKPCQKQPIFVSKQKLKRKRPKFLIAFGDFLYKV